MSETHFRYTYRDDQRPLRMRLANLAQQATSLSGDIGAAGRAGRMARHEAQARANFTAAYTAKQAADPGYELADWEQEREIERMREALVRLEMTELGNRPRTPRRKKNRLAVGSNETAVTQAQPVSNQRPS